MSPSNQVLNNHHHKSIEKLFQSIKKYQQIDQQIILNLCCYYKDFLIIWNEDEQCLYFCQLDDQYNIISIQIVTLSSLPTFNINWINLNPSENYLAIYGQDGCMIVELPTRNWTSSSSSFLTNNNNNNKQTTDNNSQRRRQTTTTTSKLLIRSFSLAERMFLTNRNLKLQCLRWHPISKRHLIILTNDNRLRLFDIFNEYEAIKILDIGNEYNSEIYSDALGESIISFDFGPSLSQYNFIYNNKQNNNDKLNDVKNKETISNELIDIYSIYVLKENGDVILLFLNLKSSSQQMFYYQKNQILKMIPPAEDNYGSDACQILCLDCCPPIIIIATCSGLLYHCIALENDFYNNDNDNDEFYYKLSIMNNNNNNNNSTTTIIIPEIILNVIEIIELTFPLIYNNNNDNFSVNNEQINTSLNLFIDPKDGQRYYCQHSYGIHCIMVSFFKQLIDNSMIKDEFYDDKSIVEYLICTKTTFVDNDQQQNITTTTTFPIGIALTIRFGLTSITILLNTGELINKRISNIVLLNNNDNVDDEDNCLINDNKLIDQQQQQQQQLKKPNFSQHIQRLLIKSTNLPLIKTTNNNDNNNNKNDCTKFGLNELAMLLNSIDVLRMEYLDKFQLAAKAIDKRKTVLNIEIDVQLNQLENFNEEKNKIIENFVKLNEKYENINDLINKLNERLENLITIIYKQKTKMSDIEIKLSNQLTEELKNIDNYREQFELIKQKQRYQKMQMKKFSLQQRNNDNNNIDDDDDDDDDLLYFNNNEQLQSSKQLKNIKQILANQSKEITELISIINVLKKKQ